MGEPVYKFKRGDGSGGFLCPPGHPNLVWSIEEYNGPRGRVSQGSMSIDTAAESEWLPGHVVERAKQMLRSADLVESELWVRNVYGYFRTMYVGEDGDRRADKLISDPSNSLPPERHGAVACIRTYFPDHQPRVELIINSEFCYGAYNCTKCGHRVQYEARYDALCRVFPPMPNELGTVPWRYKPECDEGGKHEWPAAEVVGT